MTSYHNVNITSTIEKITQAIGEPIYKALDEVNEKVQVEWEIKLNNQTHYIYSWKEYRMLQEDSIIVFHIGSIDWDNSMIVKNFINQKL